MSGGQLGVGNEVKASIVQERLIDDDEEKP